MAEATPVWLAAYPRSGVTYLRHVLTQCLGVPTFTAYNEVAGPDTGAIESSHLRWPDDAPDDCPVAFIKTHEGSIHSNTSHKAVYLVRDGRDALVSHTYYSFEFNPWLDAGESWDSRFRRICEGRLRRYYEGDDSDCWDWSGHVDAWLTRAPGLTHRMRFENLIADPRGAALEIAKFCEWTGPFNCSPDLQPFHQLHINNPQFYRRGTPGGWMDYLSDEQHELFWDCHGDAMDRLEYAHDMPVEAVA